MSSEVKPANWQLVSGMAVPVKTAELKAEDWLGREGEIQAAASAFYRDIQMRGEWKTGVDLQPGQHRTAFLYCSSSPG